MSVWGKERECECVRESAYVCVCGGERESVRVYECVTESVYVCLCGRERENVRETEYVSCPWCSLTWLALVQVAALSRLAGALGHQDVEVPRLAHLPEAASGAAHTPAGERAALPWGRVALDQHRVLGTAGGELDLAPRLGAVWTLLWRERGGGGRAR